MGPIRKIAAVTLVAALVGALVAPGLANAVTSPDNDIPGVVLPASPFTGALADTPVELMDLDDVFQVPLAFNERIDMTMTVDPQLDADLYLLPPGTKNLYAFQSGLVLPVASSVTETIGATEKFTYVSDRSLPATWYLDVSWWSGAGNYNVTYAKTQLRTPDITATAPSTCSYGGSALVTGTASVGGMYMTGFKAAFQSRAAGTSAWKTVAQSTTATDGVFAFTARPLKQTQFRVRTTWSPTKSGTDVGWGFSAPFTIWPRAYLAFRSTPSVAAAGRAFTVTGYLKPSHTTSTRHVKIVASRKVGTTWVPAKTVYARSSGTGFSATFALPRGAWLLRSSVPTDTLHAATVSGARYVSVR